MFVPALVGDARVRHSEGMRLAGRLVLLAVAATCASSCSASQDANGSGGPISGGQTGSLIPCAPGLAARSPVPSGDGLFILQDDDCPVSLVANDVQVVDPYGNIIPVTLEPLPGGALLVRSGVALEAGVYDVGVAGENESWQTELTVFEPRPLPVLIGTLAETGASNCEATFVLDLDDAAAEYAPLMRLSVSVDGGPPTTWLDYGVVQPDQGRVALQIADCDPVCLGPGAHELTLSAEIAGETAQPEPVELQFEHDCREESGSCSLVTSSTPPIRRNGRSLVLAAVAAFVAAAMRRRRTDARAATR